MGKPIGEPAQQPPCPMRQGPELQRVVLQRSATTARRWRHVPVLPRPRTDQRRSTPSPSVQARKPCTIGQRRQRDAVETRTGISSACGQSVHSVHRMDSIHRRFLRNQTVCNEHSATHRKNEEGARTGPGNSIGGHGASEQRLSGKYEPSQRYGPSQKRGSKGSGTARDSRGPPPAPMSSASSHSSTLSPTKGSSASKPLDDDHVEELWRRSRKASSQDEVEVVSHTVRHKRGVKRHHDSESASSSASTRPTKQRSTQGDLAADPDPVAETSAPRTTADLKDLAYRLKRLSEGQFPPRRSLVATSEELQGLRDFPEGFPTGDNLYATDVRPSALPNVLPVYKCACCGNLKSCPVWYPNCKHSGCYVCTFLHLEQHWDCPECARPMYEAPRRDRALEEEIRQQYPEWIDRSASYELMMKSSLAVARPFFFVPSDVAVVAPVPWRMLRARQKCTKEVFNDLTSFVPTLTTGWWRPTNTPRIKHTARLGLFSKLTAYSGRQVRRERVRGKRKIAKTHISRVALPDLVEDWACATLRQTYEVFKAALDLDGEFDESEFAHWISSPPFDASAIALADEPDDAHYLDWLACLVDGCLLRRERVFEAALKEELGSLGKKQTRDRLRTDVKSLLTQDWEAMRRKETLYRPGTREHTVYERHVIFLARRIYRMYYLRFRDTTIHQNDQLLFLPDTHPPTAMSTTRHPIFFTRFFRSPPTRDDALKMQDLKRDCELPRGQIRSFVNVLTGKHWQITLAGRIVAVVQEPEARYLVLEALPGDPMLQDFQEMVWALGRLKDRAMQTTITKGVDSWTRPGRNGFDSGYVYVHITSKTQLTTHAVEREEPWIVEPVAPLRQAPVDPLAVGAAVFCVAHLLQIDNQLHDEPPMFSKQWVVKCRFLSRLHRPSGSAQARHPAMLVFFSRGGVPGGPPVSSSEELPVRDDSDEAAE
ncbi:hypothetical protein C8F01DRAFT_1085189 [Mycena amicta]|nr:hypothetical protein C8F01DRAFT_1085189 [Mycena amicta]